jgi:hypothetical protein
MLKGYRLEEENENQAVFEMLNELNMIRGSILVDDKKKKKKKEKRKPLENKFNYGSKRKTT